MKVIITPGVQLTPLCSTGFSHSWFSAMAEFGLVTFSDNNRALCYYCNTASCSPFGREIRERSSGLQLGFVYLFDVADSALGFRKFCLQCTKDIKYGPGQIVNVALFYCTATKLTQLMSCMVVNICCKVSNLLLLIHLQAGLHEGFITEWQQDKSDAEVIKEFIVDPRAILRIYLFSQRRQFLSQWLLNRLIFCFSTKDINLFLMLASSSVWHVLQHC